MKKMYAAMIALLLAAALLAAIPGASASPAAPPVAGVQTAGVFSLQPAVVRSVPMPKAAGPTQICPARYVPMAVTKEEMPVDPTMEGPGQSGSGAPADSSAQEDKIAYLTFDDGPAIEGDSPAQNTPAILDILAKYHIKATFFVMGAHANMYPELLKREYNEGHVIGNHTYSHVDSLTTPDAKFISQVRSTEAVIFRILGFRPDLLRTPFGHRLTPGQRKGIGLKVCGWNLDTRDWAGEKAEKIIKHVQQFVDKGKPEIRILFHDRHAQGLEQVIQVLMAGGYRFDTLDHWSKKK